MCSGVSMAGVDAAAFLRQNAGRVDLLHLKDRAPGTPVHYDIATVPEQYLPRARER